MKYKDEIAGPAVCVHVKVIFDFGPGQFEKMVVARRRTPLFLLYDGRVRKDVDGEGLAFFLIRMMRTAVVRVSGFKERVSLLHDLHDADCGRASDSTKIHSCLRKYGKYSRRHQHTLCRPAVTDRRPGCTQSIHSYLLRRQKTYAPSRTHTFGMTAMTDRSSECDGKNIQPPSERNKRYLHHDTYHSAYLLM